MRKKLALGFIVFAFLAATTARSQVTTGTISGTVTDSTGAVLPAARVVILNEETGISRTVTTDAAGRYNAPSLGLGQYKVTASMEGFQSGARSGIVLTIGRQAVVNFELQVGAVTQTVEVTGEAPLVETTRGGLGETVDSATISELPLNGRDLAQLIVLQTGALEYNAAGRTGEGGKILSIGGGRPTTNVFLMDGVAIETYNQKTPTGTSQNFLGVDAVREFKVQSNAYSAEFGRGAGAVFNIATKSGTNEFHGSLFEFLRNDNLDAAKWEANKFELGKPEFKRNQFGGSLGGPIVRDHTFFFGTYEGYRERLGRSLNSSTFTSSIRQTPGIDARVLPYLPLWPLPNGQIQADNRTGDYNYSFSQPTDENFFQGRLDHKLTESDSVFARYTLLDSEQNRPGGFPQFLDDETVRNQYATLEWSRIFSPTFLNTFRYGFTRANPFQSAGEDPQVNPSLRFVPDVELMGDISVTGVSSVGQGITADSRTVNSFQWVNDSIYTRGSHSFKFGLHWDRIQFNGFNPARDAGNYSFGSIEDFFIARVNRFRGSIAVGYNDAHRSVRENIIGLYFQDDYRVHPRLTLNLGLRYEFITVPVENHGRVGTFRGDLAFIQQATVSQITLGNPWFDNPSLKNFAPRFGFAWDVFGDGKTAFRGGFGIFHLQFNQTWIRTTAFRMPPFLVEIQATSNVPFPNIYQLCGRDNPFNPVNPQCVGRPAPDFAPHNFRTPYVMQYNLNVQRQLTADTVVTIGYAGSRGVTLPGVADLNIPIAQQVNGRLTFASNAARPNRNFDDLRYRYPVASSFYNSLQISLNRKMSSGWQYGVAYTFSKNIDDTSGNQTAGDTDAGPNWITYYHDKSLGRGLSSFDSRNIFNFSTTYELPFGSGLSGPAKWALAGWQAGGILTLSAGIPGTIGMGSRMTNIGIRNESPDLLSGNSNNPSSGGSVGCTFGSKVIAAGTPLGTPDLYFDPCVFAVPPAQTLGNLGRNTLILPGRATLDFTLSKNFNFSEERKLQFRVEMFNLFNRPNFGIPSQTVFDNRGRANLTAGRIDTTVTSARQIQMGLKYTF